ncbi:MAG: hypothetical protein ACKVHE_23760, partial [Planctomycetales bacterium]
RRQDQTSKVQKERYTTQTTTDIDAIYSIFMNFPRKDGNVFVRRLFEKRHASGRLLVGIA